LLTERCGEEEMKPIFDKPLENVVFHSPAETRIYLGSPSIATTPDGALVASHDLFGPGSPKDRYGREHVTRIYRSEDGGETWGYLAEIEGAFWSTLFWHGEGLFLLGCSAHYGDIVIRRSEDGGRTWTTPSDKASGLLFQGGPSNSPPNYHCAPVPVLEHRGRLWRAFEDNTTGNWPDFSATVISAEVGSELLRASSWRMTNKLPYDREADPPEFSEDRAGWLEGNVATTPAGEVWNILRVNSAPIVNKAAVTRVSPEGTTLTFDPEEGFIDFPGGMSKFSIRYDEATGLYWALSNEVFNRRNPWQRNVLVVSTSEDLIRWKRRAVLLYVYEDEGLVDRDCKVGFQYPDWIVQDDDMLILVRTALNAAHSFHDANYITFHRLKSYANLL